MRGVPHHMLDVAEPNDPYSVAQFQRGAYGAIDGILSRGKLPFLVGGTGLYLRAVTEGFVFTGTSPDPWRTRPPRSSTPSIRPRPGAPSPAGRNTTATGSSAPWKSSPPGRKGPLPPVPGMTACCWG